MTKSNLTPKPNKDNLAIVYTTYALPDAHIVVGRLQSEGIPAIVDHMPGMTSIGITVGAMGEIRVLVHIANYERAINLLEPIEPEQLSLDNEDIIIFDEGDEYDE